MKSSTGRDPICGMEVDPKNAAARKPAKKYFCPMCEGVESDQPGACPKCGMALERNPTFRDPAKIIYTCPMHPQIEQDHPGNCPICGMTLEPQNIGAGSEEENVELHDMTRRMWIGGALTLPVFLIAMAHLLPNRRPGWTATHRVGCNSSLARQSCCGPGGRSSCAAGSHSLTGASTCSHSSPWASAWHGSTAQS